MASFSVLTAFWIIKTSQAKKRSKEKRRGKQSEENRGQQLQSSFALLEHFLKSIFYMLYTISKLRKIQRFKLCMIWSWNEEDMAFGKQLLQACANFAPAHAWCEISSVFSGSTWDLFLCIFYVNSLLIPVTSQSQALLL